MPPSLMTALCTGPVTSPSRLPARHAAPACSSAAMVAAALAGSGAPAWTATGAGISTSGSTPGVDGVPGEAITSGSRRASAARASAAGSPKASRSASQARCAARTQSSGPTPAGSPGTSASRGRGISAGVAGGRIRRAEADVHEGFAAQFAQEALPLLFELALADALAHLLAAVLVGGDGLPLALALDDVPTGLGLERRGHLAVLQRRELLAEVHAVGVAREPAEFATARGGVLVLGVLARQLAEVGAAGHARAQRLQLRDRRGVVACDQDVARAELGDGAGPGLGLADVGELQQLEAAGAA